MRSGFLSFDWSLQKLFWRQSDISRHLPEQDRRDVPASVKGEGCLTPVRMPILPVGAALSDQHESEAFEEPFDLPWPEHGGRAHVYATCTE